MELYVILVWLLLLIFLLKSILHPSTSSTNLPPGPTGLPVIGSLLKLGSQTHVSLSQLAKTHGPIMTLHLGCITTIIISSAEAAKQVLQTHDDNFSDRPIPDTAASQPHPEGTLAWVPGDHRWRNRRRIVITQLLTSQRIDSLHHLRNQKVEQLLDHIKKISDLGQEVDIGEVVFGTSLNLVSNTVFSLDVIDPEFKTAQEFKDLVWRIMEDAGKPNVSDYFPVLSRFDIQGLKRHIRTSYMRLHEIFDEIIERRLGSRTRFGDFLDVLLDLSRQQGSHFTWQTIKPLILELFIAGSDTSAITVEWAMAELLKQPELLQRAKKELIQVIGIEGKVKETDIDNLPYLQAIVKETIRLHSVAPLLLPYKAKNDVEIFGYNIPKDTRLIINAWAINRDPKYWNESLRFTPERFLNSYVDYKGHHFEYIPFGAGRRICPGLTLAVRTVQFLLASIIYSFDWKLPEGVEPRNLNMEEQFGVTLKKAIPLRAIPSANTKRNG